MNERIRELVKQTVIAIDDPFPGNPLNDELEKMYIPDCFAEKFAELLIRECAEQVKNLRVNDYGISGAEIIREHFGVEE